MGGNLAWTLRCADGTEYRMDRWTNAMPELIVNAGFLDGTPEAISEAVEHWMAMKADWEQNGGQRPFAFPMTSSYAPYPYGLRISEYGLVVTDFQTHTLLSMQDYTSFDRIMPARQVRGPEEEDERVERGEALRRAGRFGQGTLCIRDKAALPPFRAAGWDPVKDGDEWEIAIPDGADWDAVTRLCDEARTRTKRNPFWMSYVQVKLDPFRLEEFPKTADGLVAMLARIRTLGFSLSDTEEKAWADDISERREMEAEEDCG